jgi:hypothetical protein
MSWEQILALISSGVVFVLGVLTARNVWMANRTTDKKVSVEEQQAQFGANLELNKYIDARVDALVEERIGAVRDELKALKTESTTRTRAITRILRSIASQWPPDHPGPVLDPADVAAVEETIPPQWLRRSA